MSNMFTSKDPAGVVGAQTGLMFAVMGAGIANAAVSGAAAMRQAREDSSSHQLRHQLQIALQSANDWSIIATAQARELETLRAENRRLSKVAKQNHDDLIALSRKVSK